MGEVEATAAVETVEVAGLAAVVPRTAVGEAAVVAAASATRTVVGLATAAQELLADQVIADAPVAARTGEATLVVMVRVTATLEAALDKVLAQEASVGLVRAQVVWEALSRAVAAPPLVVGSGQRGEPPQVGL